MSAVDLGHWATGLEKAAQALRHPYLSAFHDPDAEPAEASDHQPSCNAAEFIDWCLNIIASKDLGHDMTPQYSHNELLPAWQVTHGEQIRTVAMPPALKKPW